MKEKIKEKIIIKEIFEMINLTFKYIEKNKLNIKNGVNFKHQNNQIYLLSSSGKERYNGHFFKNNNKICDFNYDLDNAKINIFS